MILSQWAARWGVPSQAIEELRRAMGVEPQRVPTARTGVSEAAIQQKIRLKASRQGVRLWRNNSGATYNENGRMIRYGLANDSAVLSRHLKSSDLIGATPHIVGQEDVGRLVAIFTSIEVKRPGWIYCGTDREKAQYAWLRLIVSLGGIAKFSTGMEYNE